MELEVYSQATNRAVVKMPARHFPGLLIQGDALSSLLSLAESICEKSEKTPDVDLIDAARELRDNLQQLLSHYEATLSKHNIPLPYSKSQFPPDKN